MHQSAPKVELTRFITIYALPVKYKKNAYKNFIVRTNKKMGNLGSLIYLYHIPYDLFYLLPTCT